MKNKKFIYVLLPAALIIWGFVIIKIIVRIKRPEKELPMHKVMVRSESVLMQRDTITLIANYRDPFLSSINTQFQPARKIVEPTQRAFKPRREPVKNIQWPEIIYKGTITNDRNEQHTALVRIDHSDFLIHKGDIIKEITFTIIYPDSLRVVYQNESKTIIRK